MRFLIDAQLPRRLAKCLVAAGHDALHTLDLPQGNRTIDSEICIVADNDARIVITKDQDFVTSFLLEGKPERLLLVSTGNIDNAELVTVFQTALPSLEAAFTSCRFVELGRVRITIHG